MWLFCKSGFFSAVADRDDPSRILVRSRFKGDIDRLFPKAKVAHTPEADYPFRTFVQREEWEQAVLAESRVIDYTNFKNAVHDGTNRDTAYMSVWGTMRRAQQNHDFLTRRP